MGKSELVVDERSRDLYDKVSNFEWNFHVNDEGGQERFDIFCVHKALYFQFFRAGESRLFAMARFVTHGSRSISASVFLLTLLSRCQASHVFLCNHDHASE
jgi:hypothetical protein